ncbi:HNH endonuclease [Methylocystis echinoides]|uniref:HNH endonuclease n=1 Tax=Methylocystis echinoides TaxID=29468 RepID=UPI00341F1801
MGLRDLTRQAVEAAITEFDSLGRSTFLKRYGFGEAKTFYIKWNDNLYDSKAIAGAAHGKLPGQLPLRSDEFSGGENTVKRALENLGFIVVDERSASARNPTWARDELILALDLYVQFKGNPPGKGSSEIVELSTLLNKMGSQFAGVTREFRNANGVYMKIMNFRRFDPAYSAQGKVGLQRGGKDEEFVWNQFAQHPVELHAAAKAIRSHIGGGSAPSIDEESDIAEAPEGRLLTRQHQIRERSRAIIEAKKRKVLQLRGKLTCEACGFDFEEHYGERGRGFIEVHHVKPVHTLTTGSKTNLEDLSLLCSNCHRMIHVRSPWLTVAQIAGMYKRQ